MIRHIVMWKLKPEALGKPRAALATELKARLDALSAKIPQISRLEVGLNFSTRDVARDVVLDSDFTDRAALEAYATHPAHLEVVAFVKEIAEETRVVDYETLA